MARPLADEVLPELVRLMFTSLTSILVVSSSLVLVAATIGVRGEDPIAVIFALAALLASAARVAVSLSFAHASREHLSVAGALIWERCYLAAGAPFALVLGFFAAYALIFVDAGGQVLVMTVALAYPTGMIVRVAVRPRVARLLLIAVLLPPALAGLLVADVERVFLAGLLLAYLAAGLEMIRYLHETTSDRIRLHHQLSRLAMHDDLTGLANRRFFEVHRGDVDSQFARTGRTYAILSVDLDRFKDVNDTHGHETGDEVLRQVAQRLRSIAQPNDMIARMGGDEFAIIRAPCDGVGELAGAIVEVMKQPFDCGAARISIGASVGVSRPSKEAENASDILRLADAALYEAKRAGRGRYIMAAPA